MTHIKIGRLPASDKYKGNGATVKLQGTDIISGIEVHITYLLYPDLPVIPKKNNCSSHEENSISSFKGDYLPLDDFSFLSKMKQ